MAILKQLPPFWTVFLMSMRPIVELKGSIPVGVAMGIPLWEAFLIAWLASAVPVPFILLFLRPLIRYMKSTKPFRKFANWLEARTRRKTEKGVIRKYRLLGLFLFVAIPLPGTGVWTGSMIAALLDLRISHALPVILFGNLVAGLLMLFLTHSIIPA